MSMSLLVNSDSSLWKTHQHISLRKCFITNSSSSMDSRSSSFSFKSSKEVLKMVDCKPSIRTTSSNLGRNETGIVTANKETNHCERNIFKSMFKCWKCDDKVGNWSLKISSN
ncbi:hypothetical protein WICPIJ_005166 [Wickerhamomyces pijperi]|uniref:Uncharacterized protein n=1 Tax=Wickerhamomyces pijperi TaxID=599730 RepID=A0A9P8Q432_WICPI|nr:hypothetical protein WICPIJ_005166 [Wickerhamomyces pijperi]